MGGDRIAIVTKVIGKVQYIRGNGSGQSLKKGHIINNNNKNLTDKPIFIDFYADW